MTNIKYQLNLFFLALSFFSRLPVPRNLNYSPLLLNQSSRYFSLVGIVLAFCVVGVYQLSVSVLPLSASVLLVMIASVMLTGAFHEDGLADMADGIGGGLTVEKRLSIMKDSRLGTYGTITLMLTLTLKFILLFELAQQNLLVLAVLVSYPLSRALAASLIYDMNYVSDEELSKSKPLAARQSSKELLILFIIGILPSVFLPPQTVIIIVFVLFIFRQGFKAWLNSRLGGYTGDCLGAAQQIAELLIYLIICATILTYKADVAMKVTL
ncbi:adenosylcobinamide-GDP ribazoletransferase [Thalassotalea crassostreae]|uniref:adenosylcobinamide-GDP ribazoletransferase n=1 Tax=Thalassotalea crassostreae TaxID=1763536 RepID=UPI00083889DA|nr:adenosylcobinamide-GDP ribazoletransferase [Thalassotalea crassostreae]